MEYLQLFDENKNIINEKIDRNLKKTLIGNKFFMIVLLFIENENKFLLQKTSKSRHSETATTGGHVTYGDNGYMTVIKEAKEELGIEIDEKLLKYVDTLIWGNCYIEVFYTKQIIDIKDINIDEEEVESVDYYSIDEINSLIKDDIFKNGNIDLYRKTLEYRKR